MDALPLLIVIAAWASWVATGRILVPILNGTIRRARQDGRRDACRAIREFVKKSEQEAGSSAETSIHAVFYMLNEIESEEDEK